MVVAGVLTGMLLYRFCSVVFALHAGHCQLHCPSSQRLVLKPWGKVCQLDGNTAAA
jgi:hypothetical protein